MIKTDLLNYDKEAIIEHNVTDVGTGGSYCSLCGERQDQYFEKRFECLDRIKKREALLGQSLTPEELLQIWKDRDRCESCGALFTKDTTWMSLGGSDF
jgi:hypothetical protein